MKTLDLLNIMTQTFIKVRIYIENGKNFFYEDYGYPLYQKLKFRETYGSVNDRIIDYIYNSEIKYISFITDKLTIVIKKLQGDYRK